MLDSENINTAVFQTTIREALESKFPWVYLERGTYTYKIDADCNDTFDSSVIEKILNNPRPMEKFLDVLDDSYADCVSSIQNEFYEGIKQSILEHSAFQMLTVHEEEAIMAFIQENISIFPPAKHFLEQSILVNIFVDTGDGNYDFSLNPHYPCFYGNRRGEPIDSKAGIVWLAKQQGYTKKQLQDALDEGDMSNPNGFLQSCRVEEANLSSSMPVVTFLVEMELQELIRLNALIQVSKKYKSNCSYLFLNSKTVTGLYDPFNGAGGVLGLQLEKDVKLPIMYIRSALPDGCDGYSIRSCYCLDESQYIDTVEKICVSQRLRRDWRDLIN